MAGGTHVALTRRPELDGIRGIAIALVVLSHASVPGFRWGGQVGVTLFFVLSGYLITWVLVTEGREHFYRRRALRLFPALAALLAVSLVVGWATVPDVAAIALYVGNWVRVFGGDLGYLGHTWSLAIEEQFYLVWPLVFVAGLRSPRALLAIAGGSAVFLMLTTGDVEQFSTIGRAGGLLVGGAIAIGQWSAAAWVGWVGLASVLALSAAAVLPLDLMIIGATIASVLLVAAASRGGIRARKPRTAHAASVASSATPRGPRLLQTVAELPAMLGTILSARPLVWLGGISYALYLWHEPLLFGTNLQDGVAVAVAVLIAWASTRYLEAPFRRLSSRLRDAQVGRDVRPGPAGAGAEVAGARADVGLDDVLARPG